jgi:hypothetical protein
MLKREKNNYGLGVQIAGSGPQEYFFHTGHNTGFRSIIVGFTQTGQGAAILANGDASTQLIFELLRSMAIAYDWQAYRPIERKLGRANRKLYPSYVGSYDLFPGTVAEISTDGHRLFMKAAPLGPDPVELFAETQERYFVTSDAVAIQFVRDNRRRRHRDDR